MNISAIFDEYMHDKKICVYGLGKTYKKYISSVTACYSLRVDYYSDRDIENKTVKNKISKDRLLLIEEDVLLVIMTGKKYEDEVAAEFQPKANIKVIKFSQIETDRKYIEYFLEYSSFNVKNKKKKKIAVYTYISNKYDELIEPMIIDDKCDYYFISDIPPNPSSLFNWIDIRTIIPQRINNPIDQNRYCKMHGSEIFNEYQYSIYLDGHLQVIGEISKFIAKISDIGLALYNHPQRNDIYAEGMAVCNCGMGDANEVKRQLRRYMDEGMPIKYGLFMCGVIVRDNRNKLADKIMHEWFYEYMRGEINYRSHMCYGRMD